MRSTCLTVSLSAIEENYRRIRAALAPRVQVIAVVKADAYGHGATRVARRLESAGADMFAVAILEEALALREAGVSPAQAVHIGDSQDSDVRGAQALGIRALWLNRDKGRPGAPEEGFACLADMLAALR